MLSKLSETLRSFWKAWDSFWFESDGHLQMKTFRTVACLLMFFFYLMRSFDLAFLFGNEGLLPVAIAKDLFPSSYRDSVFFHFTGDRALHLFNAVFLASLLGLAFGKLPRLLAAIALVLQVSFVHRNMMAVYGADSISTFFLFFLCFASFRPKAECGKWEAVLGSVAFRLAQIQICVIYGFAGLHKLRGPHWWQGDAVWNVMANSQYAWFDFSWMAHFPAAVVFGTYLTLAWEIYFPILVWLRFSRYPVLLIGVALHAGMSIVIGIPFFGALMASSYLLFLKQGTLERAGRVFFGRFIHRKQRALHLVPVQGAGLANSVAAPIGPSAV